MTRILPNGQVQSELLTSSTPTAGKPQVEEKAGQPAAAVAGGDTFQLSAKHNEVQQLAAQAAQVPDVRADRVAPLQAQVKNGSYKPDSAQVASAILKEQTRNAATA